MPEQAPLSSDTIREAMSEFFGEKAQTIMVDTSSGTIDAHLYGAVTYQCGYSEWHQGVWEFQSVITIGGVRTPAIGSIEQDVHVPGISTIDGLNDEFARVDEHCRLLLPDKYLERFDGLHNAHPKRSTLWVRGPWQSSHRTR